MLARGFQGRWVRHSIAAGAHSEGRSIGGVRGFDMDAWMHVDNTDALAPAQHVVFARQRSVTCPSVRAGAPGQHQLCLPSSIKFTCVSVLKPEFQEASRVARYMISNLIMVLGNRG